MVNLKRQSFLSAHSTYLCPSACPCRPATIHSRQPMKIMKILIMCVFLFRVSRLYSHQSPPWLLLPSALEADSSIGATGHSDDRIEGRWRDAGVEHRGSLGLRSSSTSSSPVVVPARISIALSTRIRRSCCHIWRRCLCLPLLLLVVIVRELGIAQYPQSCLCVFLLALLQRLDRSSLYNSRCRRDIPCLRWAAQ